MIHEGAGTEIASGKRFDFGSNWRDFLQLVDDDRIVEAQQSLAEWLGVTGLAGQRFVDVGSGSGLFSLAARRMGAGVVSFDFDASSVACTRELRDRFAGDDPGWRVEHGSVLDTEFLGSLGTFDVVYAWGVLHHTGALFEALDNVVALVAPAGRLYISVYNDQGWLSQAWRALKRRYNASSPTAKSLLVAVIGAYFRLRSGATHLLGLRRGEKVARGMSSGHDLVDWVGGYPFEVAKPEEVFEALQRHGLDLERLRTCARGHGCNEFLFRRPVAREGQLAI